MAEKYIMVSMGDESTKHISEVLGNKTCKKILDVLVDEEMTETDISKKLGLPLNTIDYNIKKLIKSKLIEQAKQHFWSTKGKKMPVYKVSNKKIVISPRRSLRNIKTVLITAAITGLSALTLKQFLPSTTYEDFNAPIFEAATSGAKLASDESINQVAGTSVSSIITSLGPWSWFLMGAWAALAIFLLINIVRRNK